MDANPTAPLRLVTFDLYDTLIELVPRRWDRMATTLRRLGIGADVAALRAGDLVAEDFYTEQNIIEPIRERRRAEREAFRLAYIGTWLAAARIPADLFTIRAVREAYMAELETPAVEIDAGNRYGYRTFPDVVPALKRLRAAGIKGAVVSNADDELTTLCEQMAIAAHLDAIATSARVGHEKPDARLFRAVLDPLGIPPDEALHVGTQTRSDIAGALGVGMRAALIDRYARHDPAAHDVPVYQGLADLVNAVLTKAP